MNTYITSDGLKGGTLPPTGVFPCAPTEGCRSPGPLGPDSAPHWIMPRYATDYLGHLILPCISGLMITGRICADKPDEPYDCDDDDHYDYDADDGDQ